MKQFAVIGDPIAHSLSPLLHQEINGQLGLEAEFEKIHITSENLQSFMDSNKLNGFNVTIPLKQFILPFLNELDESAQAIGAVNCVHHGKGFNTDWIGFTKAMELNGVDLTGKDCAIIGAGGVARAVTYALLQSEVKFISIVNRTLEKANQLKQWIGKISNVNAETLKHIHSSKVHIIINCTPLGMWPETQSMPEINIQRDQVLADTIYNPLETKWLKTGKDMGAKTVGGLDMFIAQGLASADIWFGEKISEKIQLEPIKKVLKSELC